MSSIHTVHPFRVVTSIPADASSQLKIIGTHSGNFHCDEALACALLTLIPQEFKHDNTLIVRSRDMNLLNQCAILVDVGAIYDPQTHRYDHHQKEFDQIPNNTFSESYKTKLSSAGLVYKHFGKTLLQNLFNSNQIVQSLNLSEQEGDRWINTLYEMIYKNYLEHIDAIDNGIEVSSGPLNYKITSTISHRVGRLNPKWNTPQMSNDYENEQFQKAIKMTGDDFLEVVNGYLEQWLPARSIVLDAVNDRFNVDPSGQIIRFDRFAPWKDHLFDIERELGIENEIKLALFTDPLGSWRIQSVPVEGTDFQNRCPLPEAWRGLRDEELSTKSSIPGCVFVHMSGFIGGNKTYDGVIAMAKEALKTLQ